MMSRLGGRARDIIKVTLRSNPSLKPGEDPRVITDILKQHFSELTYSAMPLADFYSTLPTVGENAMDYWIRLNKAVDVAEDCLKRQGRNLEDPRQKDDLILGSNVIKYLMHEMKSSDDYWRVTAQNCDVSEDPDTFQFLNMMAGVTRWQGAKVPSKIGTVKLTQAVTLLAGHEHLVWGRLPKNTLLTPGSTVIVEPTSSKSMPRNILVGRVITPMWGDGYIPMKIMNLSDQPVTLKRNCKLADVSPCVAAEDFTVFQNTSQVETKDQSAAYPESNCADLEKKLAEVGLKDIDINFCQISHSTQQELVLLVSYNDIFSKHALDCGEAKGFSHRIHLTDERPFRLPYRRVPPAHYQKLRQALTEMEEQGIIRKSTSEFASPLVMIWKKDGSLRICTDCTNSQTVWRLWAGMSISVLWT
ncbi:interleukin-1 receptor accessory -like 1-A isoform X3 [Labeo rohita]|uniref:Interleukin-1 receptor accessory-like 1-A isoform X3 n=1 Tax=Labeo rohita TaxID=84645 RepID=A0A498MZW0_LABRO|nr:interleukin-1 receptor accessory -like 1-A isoform X3 [Labeo rohita]